MIIVTGASNGIGKSIVRNLNMKNIKTFGVSRSISKSNYSASCDVSNYDELKDVYNFIKKKKYRIMGLVNAAGVASMNLAITTPHKTVTKIINTNLIGTIFSCQVFTPLIIKNGFGSIINFSTIAVALKLEGESIYVASKAGVEAFTQTFAKEISNYKICANCISPGPIDTNLIKNVPKDKINKIIEKQIIKKKFSINEINITVEFLLSKNTNFLSGQIFNIGGN
jgi:3-oxoacyl-[acyl-carrier protein] reductase